MRSVRDKSGDILCGSHVDPSGWFGPSQAAIERVRDPANSCYFIMLSIWHRDTTPRPSVMPSAGTEVPNKSSRLLTIIWKSQNGACADYCFILFHKSLSYPTDSLQ